MNKKLSFNSIMILLIIVFSTMSIAQGVKSHHCGGQGKHRIACWEQLSDTQKAELKTMIASLKESGADKTQIREAVHSQLADWGIDPPLRGLERFKELLTETQFSELTTLVNSLKEQNADRKTIRDTVHATLKNWGIELPERGFRHFGNLLTDEQKAELEALISGKKASGATREEIRAAVKEQLEAWGIEKPENKHGQGGLNGTHGQRKMMGTNHPNPFNPNTTISYELQEPANVTVSIFNTTGQLIRTFSDSYQDAGQHEIQWNGISDTGEAVPSGLYIFKVNAGSETFSGRMMMMK